MVLCLPFLKIVLPSGNNWGGRVRRNLGILGHSSQYQKISSCPQYYSSSNFVVSGTYGIIYSESLSRNSPPLILFLYPTIYMTTTELLYYYLIIINLNHSWLHQGSGPYFRWTSSLGLFSEVRKQQQLHLSFLLEGKSLSWEPPGWFPLMIIGQNWVHCPPWL